MKWLARFSIIVDGDDPVVAAHNAQKRKNDHNANHWQVINLDSKEPFVVDMGNEKVVPKG